MMKRVLLSLLITSCFALPMSGSQSTYNGPTLHDTYEGPLVVANSQLRYLGADMLTFDTAGYLAQHAPNLVPLRPAIDTWAAMHAIHPRVLIHVLQAYWPLAATSATAGEKETVHQIATAIALIYHEQRQDPLAASKAVMAVADAYHLKVELPTGLATSREVPTRNAPQVFGWFQPPWEIGDTWAGGGAHGDTGSGTRNALDYWGEYRNWGADLSQWWVAATQAGTARVWSICSVSVIHAGGWVSTYYHLENVQLTDPQVVERNTVISNYANDEPTALCQGGSSTGPHVHSALYHDGNRVEIDEANVDFTAFSHHAGVGQYDGNCNTSWYNHDTVGKVCPYADALLNNAPPPVSAMFADGFESGDTSAWSSTMQ
ncbi:MAG: hypothetical protein WBO71_13390 [Thermoanaerobaculia bacterium]